MKLQKLELLINKLLENMSVKDRHWIKEALYEAGSYSQLADLYISYVLLSPEFNITIDRETENPYAIALYFSLTNSLVIYKHSNYWDLDNSSDLARILLHEFMHGYFSILHAPDSSPQKHEPLNSELFARPLAPSVHRKPNYKTFLDVVGKDLQDLRKIIAFYLTEPEIFAKQYPKLSSHIKELAKKYRPKFEPNRSPNLQSGHSCQDEYGDVLDKLKDNTEVTKIINGFPYIIRASHGLNADKSACIFSDHIGDTAWDAVTRNLFELYWYINASLLNQQNFDSYMHSYRYSLAKLDLACGEYIARTSEIGPFFMFLRRTLAMLKADYEGHIHLKEERKESSKFFRISAFNKAINLPLDVEREYFKIIALEYPAKDAKEIIKELYKREAALEQSTLDVFLDEVNTPENPPLQKIIEDAQNEQINMAVKLYRFCNSGTQLLFCGGLLIDGLSNLLAIGKEDNPAIGSDSMPEESNGWPTSTALWTAGATVLTVASVTYLFWKRKNADNIQSPEPIAPKMRK